MYELLKEISVPCLNPDISSTNVPDASKDLILFCSNPLISTDEISAQVVLPFPSHCKN